ncbi:aldo/keto reductase [Flavobacterium ovatum]|uniref:aldo/keto reductase n=1 Tax=Flavobacterium ovatum TaxID=1928857 RepID=UPI00344CAF3D
MKQIELVPGIKSSVLGFGCAPIKGSEGNNKSARALSAAIDFGVTHFDIARSYGYGEAEAFVGKILRPYRKDIIIASKFGIKANNKAKLLAPLKPIIRFAKNLNGKSAAKPLTIQNNNVASLGNRFHSRIEINPFEMKKSLEESLKALKTDYLDYFFVHEPLYEIQDVAALFELAEELKKEGKIRAFGMAFMQNQKELHTNYLESFDILQFNNSPGILNYEDVKKDRSNKANIFFSPINGVENTLLPEEKLLKLNEDFPESVILCSMFNEKHLASNVKLFS